MFLYLPHKAEISMRELFPVTDFLCVPGHTDMAMRYPAGDLFPKVRPPV